MINSWNCRLKITNFYSVFFLQSINFSTTVVNEALGKEKQFKNFFANVESYLRQPVRTLRAFYELLIMNYTVNYDQSPGYVT